MIFRVFATITLSLLLTACAEPPYTNVDNSGLQGLLDRDVPLVDIRRPEEWRETGVVEGSQLLTFVDESGRLQPGFLETLTQRFSPTDPVVLICRTGNRTDVLARHMVDRWGTRRFTTSATG